MPNKEYTIERGIKQKSYEQRKQELLGFAQYVPVLLQNEGLEKTEIKRLVSLIKDFSVTGIFSKDNLSEKDYNLLLSLFRDYISTLRKHYPSSREISKQKENKFEHAKPESQIRDQIKNSLEAVRATLEAIPDKSVSVKLLESVLLIENFFEEKGTNEDYETIHESTDSIKPIISVIEKLTGDIRNSAETLVKYEKGIAFGEQSINANEVELMQLQQYYTSQPWYKKIFHSAEAERRQAKLKADHSILVLKKDGDTKMCDLQKESLPKLENQLAESLKSLAEMIMKAKKEVPKMTLPYKGDRISLDNMMVVHCAAYDPRVRSDGVSIETMANKKGSFLKRNTIHTTINSVVPTHFGGSWTGSPIVYVMPMRKVLEENGAPAVFYREDTYWLGDMKIPAGSVIWIRDGHYKIDLPARARDGIKIIVTDDPYQTVSTYVSESRIPWLDSDSEAEEKIFPKLDSGRRQRQGSSDSHYYSPLSKLEHLSSDIFDLLHSRTKTDIDKFTFPEIRGIGGIIHRTLVVSEMLFSDDSGKSEENMAEYGLTRKRLKEDYLRGVPFGEMMRVIISDIDAIIERYDTEYDNELKADPLLISNPLYKSESEKLRSITDAKQRYIKNISRIALLFQENFSDISKYSDLQKSDVDKLLKKIVQLKGN